MPSYLTRQMQSPVHLLSLSKPVSWLLILEKNIIIILKCLSLQLRINKPAFLQVTISQVSQAHRRSHQPRPRTSSIRPSRPWAAAHWPIRGALARRPQPAWRPTCRVRRNASSCRTAGSWAAMWPWRAGEWPTVTYTRAGTFRPRCYYKTISTDSENKMMWDEWAEAKLPVEISV